MRCPLKVRLLRDDFGRLVFLYAVKRWSRYWTGLLHPNFSFIRFSFNLWEYAFIWYAHPWSE